jgi:hypothetical protein
VEAWLESRPAAEELLIVRTTLEAANELAREVAKREGAAFAAPKLRAAARQRDAPGRAWCARPCVATSEAASHKTGRPRTVGGASVETLPASGAAIYDSVVAWPKRKLKR